MRTKVLLSAGLIGAVAAAVALAKSDPPATGAAPAPAPAAAVSPPSKAVQAAVRSRILFTADGRGEIEPCGCKVHPTGGLARRATLVKELGQGALLVEGGDALFKEEEVLEILAPQEEHKAGLIARAMATLGYDAWVPGERDLARGVPFFLERARESKAAILAANLTRGGKPAFASVVYKDLAGVKTAVVGVVAPHPAWTKAGYAVGDPGRALERGAAEARQAGAKVVVGVLHMPFDKGSQIAAAAGLDFAALAHDGRATFKAELLGSTHYFGAGQLGRQVMVLEMWNANAPGAWKDGGELERLDRELQMIWNGIVGMEKSKQTPGLKADRIESINDTIQEYKRRRLEILTRKASLELSVDSGRTFSLVPRALGVEDMPAEPAMQALLDGFKRELKELNARIAALPLGPKLYVGVQVCATCHTAAYEVYKETSHSVAWATLVREKREHDLSCVGCHSAGFREPGGYVDPKQVGIHADVNCEACHGPGLAHSRAPEKTNIARLVPPSVCIRCHDETQAEKFVDEKYRPKILGPGHDVRRDPAEAATP